MIRLVIVAIGVFLVWLLFFSGAQKKSKLLLGFSALLLVGLSIWFEGFLKLPREGVIELQQISSCGITAKHSYRSNYEIEYCLKNASLGANVERIELRFVAEDCRQQPCIEKASVVKQRAVNIVAGESQYLSDNLAFDSIRDYPGELDWKIEVISVKAR